MPEYNTESGFPYEFEHLCSNCGVRFGSHTGSSPHWWCPGFPKTGFQNDAIREEWIKEKRFFTAKPVYGPVWPKTAEEMYEALRNG